MSFSKAKLKRFNDIDSPATVKSCNGSAEVSTPITPSKLNCNATVSAGTVSSSSSTTNAHPERKEQIEKFFKEAVRFASSSKEAKEFTIPKEGAVKEDKKSKGLRLFRTPSLPQRLRFRHNSDAVSVSNNNNACGSTTSSTPLQSTKELSKSGSRLKGKEALQQDIRKKNELIESYMSQLDVLKRHVEQLKETERKLRDENADLSSKTENLIHALQTENVALKELNDQLSVENVKLTTDYAELKTNLETMLAQHVNDIQILKSELKILEGINGKLHEDQQQKTTEIALLTEQLQERTKALDEVQQQIEVKDQQSQKDLELIENLRNTNKALTDDVRELKAQSEKSTLVHAQETKTTQHELECLKKERNTLKNDLASKCELIRSLQEELLDKNCEIDAHCDTIRHLCRENAKYAEKERSVETAEEKVRQAESQVEQKIQKLESDLETALEREKAYWRGELDRRQKLAENEIIKIELEKQDVMVLLESTNEMLRERDEKIQKYEDQLRNGIDYYIQLTDNLQKQVVDLKQDIAKRITEQYNYQLTLSNTRSTVNILMERLKKSDVDVEQYKAELESVQLAKGALEQSYLSLQSELESVRTKYSEAEAALRALNESSKTLQNEVSIKEKMFSEVLTSEEETLAKFNKIASSFQERIDAADVVHYLDCCNELKRKDESREVYIQDMRKALDEFATVLQFAQIELDCKEKALNKVREECEQLKLENISLKSKVDENVTKKENSTDLEKIEDLLIDSELRAECDKITSWLLNSSSADKSLRTESCHEINDLLKPVTPSGGDKNKCRNCTTPLRSTASAGRTTTNSNATTPKTPRTPKTSLTPRTTPRKTVLFAGKENICSPQKQVLKARNM